MKPAIQSKTIWLNLIPLVLSLNDIIINAVNSKQSQWSIIVVAVLSAANIILRFISKDQVTLK